MPTVAQRHHVRRTNAEYAGAILLVEDDIDTIEQMVFRLEREGFDVDVSEDAETALSQGMKDRYDVIILDYFLPDGDGEQVCSELRQNGIDTPVLMLTGRRRVAEKVSAFGKGADDYVTKPFAFEELLARVRALTKRGRSKPLDRLVTGSLTLVRTTRTVIFADVATQLSPQEFELLAYLIDNAERPVTRQEILSDVWSSDSDASTNTVDVYIGYLRKKIWGSKSDSPIRTVRGTGYVFRDRSRTR
jgi:two-component system copper resistance phosphate regulon response regulator CusR